MSTGDTVIETLLRGPAARGDGLAYATAVWSGMATLESQALDLRDGLFDLDVASGIALDLRGDWASESRLGLGDADSRRIIAGREVALADGVTPPAVVRGWRAVTGDPDATIDEAPSEVLLRAVVPYVVDDAWLARAAAVTRDMIGNGRELYAIISQPATFIWGVTSYDDAGFSHDFGG